MSITIYLLSTDLLTIIYLIGCCSWLEAQGMEGKLEGEQAQIQQVQAWQGWRQGRI